jgi:hypothetical protein
MLRTGSVVREGESFGAASVIVGTFFWDITGIGLWWNDRFIGAQNRL